MDVQKLVNGWKTDPDFVARVGMVLAHNGMVRGTRRGDGLPVARVEVRVDHEHLERLRREFEGWPGICRVAVEAFEGCRMPGDDLLFIVVAGDIRENVKAALAELLDRIKSEAVSKTETLAP